MKKYWDKFGSGRLLRGGGGGGVISRLRNELMGRRYQSKPPSLQHSTVRNTYGESPDEYVEHEEGARPEVGGSHPQRFRWRLDIIGNLICMCLDPQLSQIWNPFLNRIPSHVCNMSQGTIL